MRIMIDMQGKDCVQVVGATLLSPAAVKRLRATLSSPAAVKRLLDALCAACEETWPGGLDACVAETEAPTAEAVN